MAAGDQLSPHVGENADAVASKRGGQPGEFLLAELSGGNLSPCGDLLRQHPCWL